LTAIGVFANGSKLFKKIIFVREDHMGNIDEQILRAAKEIVVKFIEGGRISPSGFQEAFQNIYQVVEKTTKDAIKRSTADEKSQTDKADKPGKTEKKHK